MRSSNLVDLRQIQTARALIAPYIVQTPLVAVRDGPRLKAETLQLSGAFKLRGAFNTLLTLDEEARAKGVIAPSSGNHAVAVACAAFRLGVPATVVMPGNTPPVKREAPARWGATVEIHGQTGFDSMAWALDKARSTGLALIHPFDSDAIIAATGVIGLEILEQAPDVDAIYVPVSGGGLISGIAAAVKAIRPAIKVIGVEPALSDDAGQSFRAGQIVEMDPALTARTMADGLRVYRLGERPWVHIRSLVDDMVTVTEDEIAEALVWTLSSGRLAAEPSGAVSVAAARRAPNAHRTVAVVSGANLDLNLLATLLGPDRRHEDAA